MSEDYVPLYRRRRVELPLTFGNAAQVRLHDLMAWFEGQNLTIDELRSMNCENPYDEAADVVWAASVGSDAMWRFYAFFANPGIAALFKLTWGGR